jgi:proteasome accessory factor C
VSPGPRGGGQERLKRLLLAVPFVARHPGLTVGEVAQALGVSREQLLEELDLLLLVGRPPFQPDDFVDIYVEDDRVYVELDQRLSAPPRFTAAEGVALAAAAALLAPSGGEALTQALSRLERVLPPQAVERYRAMSRQLDVAVEAPDFLGALSGAVEQRREVELDYFTASRGKTERRRVRPYELFSHRGQWYLSGHCLSRGEPRLFRLDRVAGLEVTLEGFELPSPPPARLRPIPSREREVRVRFSAPAAPYVRERFGDDAREVGQGEVEVLVPGDSERWLTRWVLSFGGEARVLEPAWAVAAVAQAARAVLAAMGGAAAPERR